MKRVAIGLATAALALALGTVAAVSASKKEEAALAAARTQGMAEAPAVAQAAGIACQVTDARMVGKTRDPKTKTETSFYEIDSRTVSRRPCPASCRATPIPWSISRPC
jgi:hypothetical protein